MTPQIECHLEGARGGRGLAAKEFTSCFERRESHLPTVKSDTTAKRAGMSYILLPGFRENARLEGVKWGLEMKGRSLGDGGGGGGGGVDENYFLEEFSYRLVSQRLNYCLPLFETGSFFIRQDML